MEAERLAQASREAGQKQDLEYEKFTAERERADRQQAAEIQQKIEEEEPLPPRFDVHGNPLNETSEREKVVEYEAGNGEERQISDAQKKAGNYKKGHVRIHGMEVTIENPKGSIRSGKSGTGKEWSTEMPHDYGYIRRTEGKDGDHVDVFVGPHPDSEVVFVVDQENPESKYFDEHKVMLGWKSAEKAKKAYLAAYEDGWKGMGAITPMTVAGFREWLKSGDTTKRVAKQVSKYAGGFKESDHPRVPAGTPEGGQFGSGGESGGFSQVTVDKARQQAKSILASHFGNHGAWNDIEPQIDKQGKTLGEVLDNAITLAGDYGVDLSDEIRNLESRLENEDEATGQPQPRPEPAAPKQEQEQPAKQKQTDTPEFKAWFGDSKVVDEKGEPLVVYHGTAAEFSEFRRGEDIPLNYGVDEVGHFFTSGKDQAEWAADDAEASIGGESRVMSTYLQIRNPLVIPWGKLSVSPGAQETASNVWDMHSDSLMDGVQDGGHDGIIIQSPEDDLFVVFSPTQIKSATGNRGTFDPNNPDIRYQASTQSEQFARAYYHAATPTEFDHFINTPGRGKIVALIDGQPMRYEKSEGGVSCERVK
jgi:hypothetical protein